MKSSYLIFVLIQKLVESMSVYNFILVNFYKFYTININYKTFYFELVCCSYKNSFIFKFFIIHSSTSLDLSLLLSFEMNPYSYINLFYFFFMKFWKLLIQKIYQMLSYYFMFHNTLLLMQLIRYFLFMILSLTSAFVILIMLFFHTFSLPFFIKGLFFKDTLIIFFNAIFLSFLYL